MNREIIESYKQQISEITAPRVSGVSSRTKAILASSEKAGEMAKKSLEGYKSPQERKLERTPEEFKNVPRRFIAVKQDDGISRLQDLGGEAKLMTASDIIKQSDAIGAQTQAAIAAGKAFRDRIRKEDQEKFIKKYGQEAADKAQAAGRQMAQDFAHKRNVERLRATHDLGVDPKNLSALDTARLKMLKDKRQSDFEKWDRGEISDPKGTPFTPEQEKLLFEPNNKIYSSSGVDVTRQVSRAVGFDTDLSKSRTERVLAQSERAAKLAEKSRLFR